jgi:hypothetical protein
MSTFINLIFFKIKNPGPWQASTNLIIQNVQYYFFFLG